MNNHPQVRRSLLIHAQISDVSKCDHAFRVRESRRLGPRLYSEMRTSGRGRAGSSEPLSGCFARRNVEGHRRRFTESWDQMSCCVEDGFHKKTNRHLPKKLR